MLREGTSSCPISSSWTQRVPMFAPPPCKLYRQRWPNASDWLCIPRSTLDSDWTLSKSDQVVLISRVPPSSYTPVQLVYPDTLPSPCLLITMWQLVKTHGVIRNEPQIHVYSHYITHWHIYVYAINLSLSLYIYIYSKLADCSQRQPKGSLFNSYHTKV